MAGARGVKRPDHFNTNLTQFYTSVGRPLWLCYELRGPQTGVGLSQP